MGKRRPRSPEQQEEDLQRLFANGFDHVVKGPYHYRVEGVADFWPSSGKWLFLDQSNSGFGVADLIGYLKIWRAEQEKQSAPAARPKPDVGGWRFEAGYWR